MYWLLCFHTLKGGEQETGHTRLAETSLNSGVVTHHYEPSLDQITQ